MQTMDTPAPAWRKIKKNKEVMLPWLTEDKQECTVRYPASMLQSRFGTVCETLFLDQCFNLRNKTFYF